MQFKQGDKAVCTLTDGVVEVKSDLFTSAGTGVESYLVEWTEGIDKGKRSVVYVTDLEPAPRFRLEQRVKESDNTPAVVVNGPFPDYAGDNFWVVQLNDGSYDRWWEVHMTAV